MSESYSGEHDEIRADRVHEQQTPRPEHEPGLLVAGDEIVPYSGALLGDSKLDGRPNTPVRSAVMGSAQKTHGNRSVQRFLQAQRVAAPAMMETEDDMIARRIESKAGGGGGLDDSTLGKLQGSLGADFSKVRVHTDREADELSRSMQAVAFTSGNDIFFRQGAYNPSSSEGMKLLAHEATHTVQQSAGPVEGTPSAGGVSISDPSDKFEQAAEQAAEAVASGGQGDGQVQRQRILDEETGLVATQRSVQRSVQRQVDVQRWPGPFFNPTPTLPDWPTGPYGPVNAGPFYNPTPNIPLPFTPPAMHPMPGGGTGLGWEPSGNNEAPGPYAYAKTNKQGGAQGGFAAFHGQGDILGVNVTDDILYGNMNVGAWDDGKGGTRYGIGGNAGVANWTIGSGSPFQLQAEAGTASAEASAGDSGATLGAQATAVGGSVTLGNFDKGDSNNAQMRMGLSAGVGAAGRLHWGKEGDGHRAYGFGFDYGPVSFDYKTQDPLRSGIAAVLGAPLGPLGMYGVDKGLQYLMGKTNITDEAGDAAKWLYNKGGEGWDAAKKYGGEAWDATKQFGSDVYQGAKDLGNRAYEGAGELWQDAKTFGSNAYDTVSTGVSNAYDAVSSGASSAYNTASEYAGKAYDTVSSGVSGAYDTVSSGVGKAVDWLTDW
jgi:hypothetical protein